MSSQNRRTTPNPASAAPTEDAYFAAYRTAEPVRQVDPFRASALQQLIRHESRLRAARERVGPRAWLARWFRSASRPALAGAALSLALLITSVPLGAEQQAAEPIMRSDPATVMSETPEGGAADALPAPESVVSEPRMDIAETPWLAVTGAIGLVVSLLAAERARRRRRA
jgi:hypothetical protein